jgi:hypothetical protein
MLWIMNQKIKTGGNLVRVAKIDGKKMEKMSQSINRIKQ